jgi:phospholipid/cholesterol/gamma-HCH transport system ATP-binding protein
MTASVPPMGVPSEGSSPDAGQARGTAGSTARAAGQTPKIRIRDLYKSFGPKDVLCGLDLDVGAGESVVVIGGSGSGKSVTLKCVLGLLHPEAGSVQVDGEEVVGLGGESLEQIRRKFGMLFQNAALFDSLTVWENVAFGLTQGRGMGRREAHEIALDKLASVGLESDVGEMSPAELSGGMRKRVGLARAIATSPEIMFFDEPTTGLDPIMGDVIDDLIVKCVRELGASALSITHDMASARKIADRIAMLYEGKIIWVGPTAEIDHSNNPYVDQFINGRDEGPITMMVNA